MSRTPGVSSCFDWLSQYATRSLTTLRLIDVVVGDDGVGSLAHFFQNVSHVSSP